ncbi:MAG: hypothetical protein FJY10_00210 [Bacteroidetes bacterium]|nr:hypothetical protein [Bacteroidota bacterium]
MRTFSPVVLWSLFSLSLAAMDGSLLTYYEQSGFKQTPRYAETIDFYKKLDAASPWISYQSFGKSAQGRDLPLLILDTHGNMDEGLTQWQSETLEPFLKNEMEKAGFSIFPYVWFRNWHDPASGLSAGVSPPMLSQGYTALRNCPGLLIETHMLKPYQPRVASTYEMIRLCVERVDRDRETLLQLIKQADAFCASDTFRKEPYPLDFTANPNDSVMVDILGVEYDSKISDLTGGPWVTYYKEKPKTLHIPFFNKIDPSLKANLPVAYIIPAEWTDVINLLKDHDIEMNYLAEETTILAAMFRLNGPKWQEQPYEGRHVMSQIEGKTAMEDIRFPAGSAIVGMSQRSARLIPYILEPSADGSLLSWGFFDAVTEQKEYAESYVMEVMAREMILEKPELLQELEEKKKSDPEFTKNPRNIINWFYMKSPYWDQKKNLYPVGKIMDPGVLKSIRLR